MKLNTEDTMANGIMSKKSPFPHLNNWLPTPLAEQDKLSVSTLAIDEMGRLHTIPSPSIGIAILPIGTELVRVFVAKVLYRYPTTSDLYRTLQSAAVRTGYVKLGQQVPCRSGSYFFTGLCYV